MFAGTRGWGYGILDKCNEKKKSNYLLHHDLNPRHLVGLMKLEEELVQVRMDCHQHRLGLRLWRLDEKHGHQQGQPA